jgi:hypothetical protein
VLANLQTKLQTSHAAHHGTGHNKVRSSEEKCRTRAHSHRAARRSTFQVKVNTSAARRSFFTKNALFDSSTFIRRSKSSTLFKRALTSREPDKSET